MTQIITDTNYRDFVQRSQDAGFLAGAMPRQSSIGGLACAQVYAEHVRIIPESEWEDRIRAMQGRFARQIYERQSTNLAEDDYQNGLPYCWAFSFAQTVKACRAIQGLPYVNLAPESLGGDVNWRSAGNYLDSTIEYAASHGVAAREYVPRHSIRPSTFKDGWEQNALKHVPLEWWDLGAEDMWAETVSVLLSGFPVYVGLNWWSHAVMYDELVVVDGEICVHSPNTHGSGQDVILSGRRKVPSLGCFAPRSVTFSEE